MHGTGKGEQDLNGVTYGQADGTEFQCPSEDRLCPRWTPEPTDMPLERFPCYVSKLLHDAKLGRNDIG